MPDQLEVLADVIKAANNNLGAGRVEDLASSLTQYTMHQIFQSKGRYAPQITSGPQVEFNILDQHSNQARGTKPFGRDDVDVRDVLKKGQVPWRTISVPSAWDELEILTNRQPEQIVDLARIRRMDAMIAKAEVMENMLWTLLDTADDTSFYGLPYWIVKNATQGYNGGNPSGFSLVANIDTSVAARYRNWTDQYAQVTKEDLIRKMRLARLKTKWRSPVMGGIPDYNLGGADMCFCNFDTSLLIEEYCEAQNENLGGDVAPMGGNQKELFYRDGHCWFRGNPIVAVEKLEDDTSDPVYMVSFACFGVRILKGRFFRSKTGPAPNQHTTIVTWWDTTLQTYCTNRRKQAVISK